MASQLSSQQKAEFRQILKQRFLELRELVRQELVNSDNQHFIDYAEQVHDLEDASVADLLVDLGLATIDRYIEEIRDVDAALMGIAEGSYGVCIDCDESIPVERLRAHPMARRCTSCQQRFEETHAHPAHTSL